MLTTGTTRRSAVFLLAVGFAAGVAFVVGCGGSSGAVAQGGSTTTADVFRDPGPFTWQNNFTFTVDFTPPDPTAIILAVHLRCSVQTPASGVQISLRARRGVIFQTLGDAFNLGPSGATANLSIVAPYAFGSLGAPQPTQRLELFMNATVNAVDVTVSNIEIRVITTEGVMVMDPSPNIS